MAKLRYSRAFKNGIIAIMLCILLTVVFLAVPITAIILYDDLVGGMKPLEATIVHIDLDFKFNRRYSYREQEIGIVYEVDGVTYNRQLKTDTVIAMPPGLGTYYSLGEKIDIFYDPENPAVIAVPRSMEVACFWIVLGFALLVFFLCCFAMTKKRAKKFLLTQEEYEKEKEERKKRKQERKEQKKNTLAGKIGNVIRMIFLVAAGIFVLLFLLGVLSELLGR